MNEALPTNYRLETPPKPPDALSPAARREWLALAPVLTELGTLRGADLRAFSLLAELLADIARMEAILAAEGYTTPSAGGSSKASPLLNSLAGARRHAQSLLDRFGLLPGSKAKRAPKYNEHDHRIFSAR